jgi:hypothetical protein
VLKLLPTPHEENDVFQDPAVFPFEPLQGKPPLRHHQNFSKLHWLDYVPLTNDTHYVTDCLVNETLRLRNITARLTRVTVADAVVAYSVGSLRARGYPRGDGTFVSYYGGGLYFMRDGGGLNLFNPSRAPCSVWPEPLVMVSTNDHWLALTGDQFPVDFADLDSANVRAVIDGVQLPPASVRVVDVELVAVLVPAGVGRRRLQLDVNGIRTGGLVLVNAKPLVHGFMEWRLGNEDVRGLSPATEDRFKPATGDPAWGGFGSWDAAARCVRVEVVGFHFGGAANAAAAQVEVTAGGRACEFVRDVRHERLTCCLKATPAAIIVVTAGQAATPRVFNVNDLVLKPVVAVSVAVRVCDIVRVCVCVCVCVCLRLVPAAGRDTAGTLWLQNISTNVSRSDGVETIVIVGRAFRAAPSLLFTTPQGEAYVPTGFEDRHGGNYLTRPAYASVPTPSPTPTPEAPDELASLSATTFGSTWRTSFPRSNHVPVYPSLLVSGPTAASAVIPANHAYGQYVRVRVQSPVDRSFYFTDRVLVRFHTPTITRVSPVSLPLSGGIINVYGHSFGTGGRVLMRQRLFYNSTSVPGDRAYAGLHSLPHEADMLAYFGGLVGVTGGAAMRFPRLLSLAVKQAPPVLTAAEQHNTRVVYTECRPLYWSHTHVRCLAPPGVDNDTAVEVHAGWGVGVFEHFLYQPAIACVFNTSFDAAFQTKDREDMMAQLVLGMWIGALVGAFCVAMVALWALKTIHRDIRVLIVNLFSAVGKGQGLHVSEGVASPTDAGLSSPTDLGLTRGARPPDGSFIGSDFKRTGGKTAPSVAGSGVSKKARRNTQVRLLLLLLLLLLLWGLLLAADGGGASAAKLPMRARARVRRRHPGCTMCVVGIAGDSPVEAEAADRGGRRAGALPAGLWPRCWHVAAARAPGQRRVVQGDGREARG